MAASPHQTDLQRILRRVYGAFEERIARGLLPYEGEWLAADEIPVRQGRERREARLQFWELVAALAAIAMLGASLLLLIWALLY